jgi:AcrR family transcriptional regulator
VLEHAILDAAWEEVVAVGYDHVTMAGIAARAGTNKATLYRRWPNRTELLAAAIDRRVVPLDTTPIDTGSLRNDVIAVLQAMSGRCRGAAVVPDPDGQLAAYVRRQAAAAGFEQMDLALRHATQRGEIDTQTVSDRIARLPIDLLYSALSLGAKPVSDQLIAEIVDNVFLPLIA